ncbi:MAG: DNA polymerase III subunit delta' [Methylococcaceae bacterium]|nr:DNA polymerase III subunit delta' [Methylococcaceae bacterium]
MNAIEQMDWLAGHWRRLSAHVETGRLPQALLIAGREGLGKGLLAEAFAKRLLCRHPGDYACGQCPSCHLFEAHTHPDFLRVEPEEPGKIIPVDAIRGLIANLALKPQYSGHRVVVITPAHQMNAASANGLLKTLEEPDEHTLLLLLTDSPENLPATILSRCQRLDIAIPDRVQALSWLQGKNQGDAEVLLTLAGGAPLKALQLAEAGIIEKRGEFFAAWYDLLRQVEEPAKVAEAWSKFPGETLTEWMVSWTMDLIRLRSAPHRSLIDNADLLESLQAAARKLNLRSLFAYLDQLQAARRMLSGQVNRQLVLEELLIRWLRLARSPT